MGINGDTLEGMQYRLQTDVIDYHPDICIVMGGSNDSFMGYEPEEMQEIAREIKERLEENRIRAIFGIPIPMMLEETEAKLQKFRVWLREWTSDHIPFDEAFIASGKIRNGLLIDGVHPSHEGYRLMAQIAVDTLPKLIDSLK